MCDSEENYQDILQKNFYLFSRYIVAEDFLEQLISEDVLTVDDKEVITNKCIHHNRRERANKLVEILMTRGENGYKKFLEILEYQYPHVYQDVTKKEPRDPPPGFIRNRISDRLRIIRNLPNLLEQMKVQVEENSELESQLCVLQQLLEVSKEENAALERECEMLKNIRQENKQLLQRVKCLETDNYEHQVTINTWTTKSYHLMESLNENKDKCCDLQVKYDQLYKEYTELKQQKNPTNPAPDKVEIPWKECLKTPNPRVDNGDHYKAKVEILEQELDSYKTHSEELSTSLQRANDIIQSLEEENEKMNKDLKRYSKEKRLLDKQLTDADIKHESYFKTIQKKNDEIIELQQRSMAEQQRLTELIREKAELFEQNHQLEVNLQSCRAEIDKIKARLSGSSIENTGSSQEIGSSGSDTELLEDRNRTYRRIENYKFQRRKVVKKGYTGEKYADRLASQRRHTPGADLLGDFLMKKDDDMNDLNHKSYTLPAKANETPEKMFQREVANFRFSQKNISTSMNVNTGSFRDSTPVMLNETPEFESIHRRVPVSHHLAKYEEVVPDTASESTVYIPRTSGGSHDESRKLSTIPSGSSFESSNTSGKSYIRETGDSMRSANKRQGAECDSIISQSDSSSDNSVISDFSSHEVYTALLPKDCPTENRTGLPDKNMSRRIRMKYSNLDRLVFKGGNHTGIFITKQHKLLEINEGEQVKGIIFTPNERVNPVITNLKGCCLDDFHRLLGGEIINKKKEKELCLEVRNSKQEYMSACRWMENNNGHGDYFFIRYTIFNIL
ncbi:caspase recruitment domain-containing protein 11-like isoform X3 [Ruditapes philippinarum]|uniref:caspase recruitment domain-containing protein 11-like isoform X3 n=1 Tax=Ruditapes philippinarum TaxID=129788 RepID=UPI00295B2545|nr:caspase recruitment domain-containing protein 11-like isoform X3 [Ruditapes philippinarum]